MLYLGDSRLVLIDYTRVKAGFHHLNFYHFRLFEYSEWVNNIVKNMVEAHVGRKKRKT